MNKKEYIVIYHTYFLSMNILPQPPLPHIHIPRTLNLPVHIPIKHNSRTNMNTSQARGLNQHLDITRDPVASVIRACDGLCGDLEEVVDTLFIDAGGRGEGRETRVCGVARLVDDVDVEVFYLVVE